MKKMFFMAAFLIGTFAIATAQNDSRVPPKVKVDAPTTQTKPGGKKPTTSASNNPSNGNFKKAPGGRRAPHGAVGKTKGNTRGTLRTKSATQVDKAPVKTNRPK